MVVARTATITNPLPTCIPEPSHCRWNVLDVPFRRSTGPTTAPRIHPHRPVGSGRSDSVAAPSRRPFRPTAGDDLAAEAVVTSSPRGAHRCPPHPAPSSRHRLSAVAAADVG